MHSSASSRFRERLRYLHLADNEKLDASNCYVKPRPLLANINEKWLLYFPGENLLSVENRLWNVLSGLVKSSISVENQQNLATKSGAYICL